MNRVRPLRLSPPLLGFAVALGATMVAVPAAAQPDPFADDEDASAFEIGGALKTFALGVFPYEHLLMPEDPLVAGFAIGRLKLGLQAGEYVTVVAHPILTTTTAGGGLGLSSASIGDGQARPQAYDLSYSISDSELGGLVLMLDRAAVTVHAPSLDIVVGRQPISFGSGYFFTPMDLVTAFSPGTLDTEFKPGVDALRADFFFGEAGRVTAVAAYAGGWDFDGLIFASHARLNVAGVDFGLFAAEAYGDAVGGFEITTDIAGIGIRGEATGTFPDNEPEGAFLRAVLGASVLLPENISLLGEVYLQTIGEDDPANYLDLARGERVTRGELTLLGQTYAAGSISWELNPILRPSAFALVNLQDGSMLLSPSLSWSVADEVDVAFGAQIAHGERPKDIDAADLINPDGTPKSPEEVGRLFVPRSEFGLSPNTVFVQTRVYF